ncbi:MAG: agmatinase [Desulfonatronovibrionaceae bacterium]
MYTSFLDLESPCCSLPEVKVWPVPYQATVSFGDGAKNGPEAILRASYQIETFDPRLGQDISRLCSFVNLPFQRPNVRGPVHQNQDMKAFLKQMDPDQDFLLTLGGEHSIAFPLVEFYASRFTDLTIIQIDAHADLRPDFEGSRFSHACVMARIFGLNLRLIQMGIRSLNQQEMQTITSNPDRILPFFPWDLPAPEKAAQKAIEFMDSGPVYITFDADGLDPSIMPGTGTPEPGGLDYLWLTSFWNHLWPGPRLVGMDFCELAPVPGSQVSESTAVKSIISILTSYFSRQNA